MSLFAVPSISYATPFVPQGVPHGLLLAVRVSTGYTDPLGVV